MQSLFDSACIVLFAAAFRLDGSRGGEESPNISHVTLDGARTLCGRKGWQTNEGTVTDAYGTGAEYWSPDCVTCDRGFAKRLRDAKGKPCAP
jgi:hypothetical protein